MNHGDPETEGKRLTVRKTTDTSSFKARAHPFDLDRSHKTPESHAAAIVSVPGVVRRPPEAPQEGSRSSSTGIMPQQAISSNFKDEEWLEQHRSQ